MPRYRGRFAPTPSGPLHWGSLLTALVSFLDAKANDGLWFLRLDDLDTHRVRPGASEAIQRSLEAHGLGWDGAVVRQSDRLQHYEAALETLADLALLYYCTCPRRLVAGRRYPGTCRHQQSPRPNAARRVLCPTEPVQFRDRFAGPQSIVLEASCGDFIVCRRDGVVAYQLAAAVDDAQPHVTEVVRGRDLLASTPRQLHLMSSLGLKAPNHAHLPILLDDSGVKLSKQIDSSPIKNTNAAANLQRLLCWLGLQDDDNQVPAPVEEQLSAATVAWSSQVAQTRALLRQPTAPLNQLLTGSHQP